MVNPQTPIVSAQPSTGSRRPPRLPGESNDLTWLTIRDSEWMQVADLRFCAATCRKVCTKSGPRSALSGALGGRVASATRAFPDQRNSTDYETDWCTPQFKWRDRPPDPQLQARSPSPPCACD